MTNPVALANPPVVLEPRNPLHTLSHECIKEDRKQAQLPRSVISLANLVASVWAVVVLRSLIGLAIGCALFLVGGVIWHRLYDRVRSKEWLNASEALKTNEFPQFAERSGHPLLSLANVMSVYRRYAAAG